MCVCVCVCVCVCYCVCVCVCDIFYSFQSLMVNEDSPIIRFYPTYFDTDLNGKRHDWEAVVLIPFIDEVHNNISLFQFYHISI